MISSLKEYFKMYRERVKHATGISFQSFLIRAVLLSIALNLPSYLWYAAMGWITPAEITAIFNTSCFTAYIFSIILLGEQSNALKLLAVTLSFVGVSMISFGTDDGNEPSSADGKDAKAHFMHVLFAFVTFLGAVIFGLYEVLYKKYASIDKIHTEKIDQECNINDLEIAFDENDDSHESSAVNSPSNSTLTTASQHLHHVPIQQDSYSLIIFLANQYTAWIGLSTLLLEWTPLVPLHYLGLETFSLPPNTYFFLLISVNAAMAFSYNALFLLSIVMTSPVFAAVMVMMTIPLTAVIDSIFRHAYFGIWELFGTGLICIGFGFLMYAEANTKETNN